MQTQQKQCELFEKTKSFLSHGRHWCIEKLVNTDYIAKMVFKRSQRSQLKILVSRFLLFGEHNKSIIVENCEHNLEP